jgi:hypothetical protein
MEHPLISNLDQHSTDELSVIIGDLNRKLGIAMRSGNAHLCNQIRMAIESHNVKYQEKMQATYQKMADDSALKNKINIQ